MTLCFPFKITAAKWVTTSYLARQSLNHQNRQSSAKTERNGLQSKKTGV
jgi:hypothetical protein